MQSITRLGGVMNAIRLVWLKVGGERIFEKSLAKFFERILGADDFAARIRPIAKPAEVMHGFIPHLQHRAGRHA